MACRYAWRTRDVDVLSVKAFLNHSFSSEGTSTVKRPVHWDNTDTACTRVPSCTREERNNHDTPTSTRYLSNSRLYSYLPAAGTVWTSRSRCSSETERINQTQCDDCNFWFLIPKHTDRQHDIRYLNHKEKQMMRARLLPERTLIFWATTVSFPSEPVTQNHQLGENFIIHIKRHKKV